MPTVVDIEQTEQQRVEAWRLQILIEANYPVPLAERLAHNTGVDLHYAVNLVGSGCPHATAAKILL